MSTIEKLFLQVFERKKWIVDQVKHQSDLFDQHLASKCLLEGIAPPPWLWTPAFHSTSSDPNELKKEELISGLLLPHPQPAIPYSSSYCSLYQQPVVTADSANLPNRLCTAVHASDKGFDTGYGQPVSPECRLNDAGCASDGVSELDPSVTSPQGCRDAKISDIYHEPALSLAKIQRSKSRQRALELRNSVKAAKSRSHDKNNVGTCASRVMQSGIASLQSDHVFDLELAKPVDTNNESCAVEEAKLSNIYSSGNIISRSSGQQPSSANEHLNGDNSSNIAKEDDGTCRKSIGKSTQQPDHVNERLELVNPSVISTCGVKKAKVGDYHIKEKGSNVYSGRITRSRSSSQQLNSVNDSLKLESSSVNGNEDGISNSIQLPKHVAELMESVKPFDITYGSCGAKADVGECQNKENFVDQYAGRNARSGTACSSLGTWKHVNSSDTLGHRVTRSRSTLFNKLPLEKKLNMFESIGLQEESGTQVNVLPFTYGSDIVDQERCDAVVAETDIDSDGVVEPCSVSSGCYLDGANLSVGAEVLVSKLPSECEMFVKPKQLDFNDVEVYTLNQAPSSALEEEKQGKSSERKPFTLLHSGDIPEKVTSVDYQEKCISPVERPLLKEQEILSKNEKLCRGSSKVYTEETDGVRRISNSTSVPSVQETSEVYIDESTNTLRVSNKISKQKSSLIDHSTTLQVACENLLGNMLKGTAESNFSNENANARMDFSFEKDSGKLGVKLTKSAPDSSNLGTDACGSLNTSSDVEFSLVTGSVPFRILDETLRHHASVVSIDENKGYSVQQEMNSVISQDQNADSYFVGTCISDENNVVCSKSSEHQIEKKSVRPGGSYSSDMEGSLPQHKRRKIEDQLTIVHSSSPILREEDVMQLHVIKSPIEETHQNVERDIIKGYKSPPKLQVEEGKLSLEGRNRSAQTPSALTREQLGASSIPSLTKQATGDSQGCSLEGVAVADPASAAFDMRRQCTIEENQVLFQLEDKLELENTEHLTCIEKAMLERKSHLGKHGKFSYCSVGSPQSQSMDLINADQTMPVFEGFIVQSDDEQPCISGDRINFEKLDLPKITIERASVLERLCKSACLNTPFSHFSTTFKSQRSPNLYQSVPNGLLEGMSLPINDNTYKPLMDTYSCLNEEVNHDPHGRSYSDCLPVSSAQSAWDIRKPCTSPVGKLWDGITLNSISSGKRVSLNSELPCISEENENTYEVADAFHEGIGSKVVACSVKREPLADITENSNLPASVSEAEIFAARDSLDSVKAEFSFTGTRNRVKQKLGNHNSCKRKHTTKVKEKQSISQGANGVKRVRESVRNRSSKPKLSGKTSLRKGGPRFSEQESKRNNIISNVTSFIPLVQQKQAAAVITGKRDVKVKALEAAEATKRLAEKKENERKMKKEALKVERARLEKENLRQLELQKKQKEEERKKKDAEMAAKKRHREEGERKEKERKRKRVEEAQRQRREHEEKLRAEKDEKEMKRRATGERVQGSKECKDEIDKEKKTEKETWDENLGKFPETGPRTTVVSASDARKASIVLEDCVASSDCSDNAKVRSNLDKVTENDKLATSTGQEQSYDISPYKGSDDEDEDEDDIPNRKFIPSWVSKSSLARVVSSQQNVDPEVIFPPESFCSMAEVLLPRKHQLKLGARE